jgi:hypothetical protein
MSIVGTIYKLRTDIPALGLKAGDIGVAIEQYPDFDMPGESGATVIFDNGNFDGFSAYERGTFLIPQGKDEDIANYQFVNSVQLTNDYFDGLFDHVLKDNKK